MSVVAISEFSKSSIQHRLNSVVLTLTSTEKKYEDKRHVDIPIVRDFSKAFPKDLPGLPLTRQVKFQIYLVPGTAPVARSPYRLAPSEMQELTSKFHELSDKGLIRPSRVEPLEDCYNGETNETLLERSGLKAWSASLDHFRP
nr:putative reverse transcriptase domain-containing protein [Tanacetum cinerariifolium]